MGSVSEEIPKGTEQFLIALNTLAVATLTLSVIIIPFLESNFDIKKLRVDWFKLPTKYINKISEQTFNTEKNDLIKYHQSFSIPLEEIENVLYSNKFDKLEHFLNMSKSKISYKSSQQKTVLKFNNSKLHFEEFAEEDKYSEQKQSSQQRYDSGILTYRDINFIKRNKLQSHEIARHSDGNYTSLPEIKIFTIYETEQITRDFKKILYYSLTSRAKGASYFYYLFFHPGNILSMIKHYRSDKEFKQAIKSFEKFLELSMFKLNLK